PSSARGVSWDLRDLYQNVDDPALARDLETSLVRAQAFEKNYRGKIATLDSGAAATLFAAVQELEALYELMDKPAVFAMLLHSARTDDPRHGALLSKTREQRTAINKHLIFFELEWIQLPDQAAQALLNDPGLARYRHYLDQKRVWK